MDTPITRAEHEEFAKRMVSENQRLADENVRQNKRLDLLEETAKRLEAMNTSIEKLAVNMEGMVKEQIRQGQRLDALEGRDGEKWREVVKYVLLTVLGAAIGFLLTGIGL